jgi:hypothetical protein
MVGILHFKPLQLEAATYFLCETSSSLGYFGATNSIIHAVVFSIKQVQKP